MVFAAAPDGIGMQQPERRGPGAGSLIDVNVRLERAQFGDQFEHGFKIAQSRPGVVVAVDADAVEFELIDAVFLNDINAQFAETPVILRAGEREIAVAYFKPLLLTVLDPFLVRVAVAAPGRKPDSGRGAVLRGRLLQRGEAVWKI